MKIEIEFIDHNAQLYPTAGNYGFRENGDMWIHISKMGDTFGERVIAIHELVEFVLLDEIGITEQQVTDFDLQFEERINNGEVGRNDEPGFARDSPYLAEHTLATSFELQMYALRGKNWNDLNKKVASLFEIKHTGADDYKTIAKL